MDKATFLGMVSAVLAANLLTVMFLFCIWRADRYKRELWPILGILAVGAFLIGSFYLAGLRPPLSAN